MRTQSGFTSQLLSILIVDSRQDILDAERLLLEAEGFEVYCARTGNEALSLLSEINEPNLILLDTQLQGQSCSEFLKKLEKLYKLKFFIQNSARHKTGVFQKF